MKNYLKQLLLFSVILMIAAIVPVNKTQAQTALTSITYGNAIDTVSGTSTKILYTKVTGYRETITIIVDFTKISGTLAGTAKPVVSKNGITWYDATGFTTSDTTLVITDIAAQGKAYQCKRGYQYYGIQWTGTGTMSGSFTGTLIARRPSE